MASLLKESSIQEVKQASEKVQLSIRKSLQRAAAPCSRSKHAMLEESA